MNVDLSKINLKSKIAVTFNSKDECQEYIDTVREQMPDVITGHYDDQHIARTVEMYQDDTTAYVISNKYTLNGKYAVEYCNASYFEKRGYEIIPFSELPVFDLLDDSEYDIKYLFDI